MKWAEVRHPNIYQKKKRLIFNYEKKALIDRISHRNPSLAHKVLEQKRWIKRQHEGVEGSSHARFMMPACHDFQEAFRNKKSESLSFSRIFGLAKHLADMSFRIRI
jgi:hypothetical protein